MYPRLKELRLEKGYTLAQMGKLLEISYQAYSNYENGHREPNIKILMELSEIYDVSVDYIIGNTEERKAYSLGPYYENLLYDFSDYKKQLKEFNDLYNDPHVKQKDKEEIGELLNQYKERIYDMLEFLENTEVKIEYSKIGYDVDKKTFKNSEFANEYLKKSNAFKNFDETSRTLSDDQIIQMANLLIQSDFKKDPNE